MTAQPARTADIALVPYLAMCPWDIERWQSSGAYRRMTLGGQGAYLNLCFASWKSQPACALPDDDRDLWRLANAQSIEEWRAVKAEVFASEAWTFTEEGWLNADIVFLYRHRRIRMASLVNRLRHRPHIPADRRRAVFSRDGHRCRSCGTTESLSIDHVVPFVRTRDDSESNLQTLCLPCNLKKGAL